MRTLFKIIKKWLPIAVATASLSMLVYLTAQQSLRQGANDPQIQMAEDTAQTLNAGGSIGSVLPADKVEIANSLAPFMMIFDNSGNVLGSSATLHGAVPAYPSGVLDYARKNGEDQVTWQPEAGVRMATVAVRYNNGIVIAGRSLREVEIRETNMENISVAAMFAILAVTLIIVIPDELLSTKKFV